jgi:hypothetical protein
MTRRGLLASLAAFAVAPLAWLGWRRSREPTLLSGRLAELRGMNVPIIDSQPRLRLPIFRNYDESTPPVGWVDIDADALIDPDLILAQAVRFNRDKVSSDGFYLKETLYFGLFPADQLDPRPLLQKIHDDYNPPSRSLGTLGRPRDGPDRDT